MKRKLFYVFDMVLVGLLFFSLEHTLIRENFVIDTMLDFALVLRIIIPFLLYRYDRHAIWPVLLFTALFGWTFYSNVFYNTIMNMSGFPSIVFGTGPTFERYVVSARDSAGIIIMYGLIYWIWLMPVVVYAIQIACKLTKNNGYPWYYFIGGILFKDQVGKTFLRMSFMLAIAYLTGYEMQESLSFFALMSLSLACYYYWNRHIGRAPHWLEYVTMLLGLYVFEKAQFHIDNERITYLAASAVIIFAVCCWMAYKSRNILISGLAFLMAAFLLPSVSLGYNVYNSIEGARAINYINVGLSNNKGYMYIKRTEVINGKEVLLMGIRDRYHTTIPCEYTFVVPTKFYSPFANCVKFANGERDSAVRSVEYGYILE